MSVEEQAQFVARRLLGKPVCLGCRGCYDDSWVSNNFCAWCREVRRDKSTEQSFPSQLHGQTLPFLVARDLEEEEKIVNA